MASNPVVTTPISNTDKLKQIFTNEEAGWLLPLTLVALGIVVLRAITLFLGRMWVDSLGEKTVAAAQAHMFARLIRRDLADLNAVHSGQFVSNFLYDATLMRDGLTQSLAAVFLESVQLIGYLINTVTCRIAMVNQRFQWGYFINTVF